MNKFNLIFAIIAVSAALASCSSANNVLFSNGTSDYTIVVDPAAGESVQYAACELQHWIAEVSGATLPLVGRDGKEIAFSSERFWGCHTFDLMVPKSIYFEKHPEYFSLRDGRRVKDAQLCLSNPDVLRIAIESMRKTMRENPDYLIFSLTQNDNFGYCQCPECQAIADQYGGQSGLIIWFVNQVADAIREEFPDKYISTFAYQYTRGVPQNIQPRENVVIRLCSIECCLIHNYDECDENRQFLADLQGWSAISPHLFIWDYTFVPS